MPLSERLGIVYTPVEVVDFILKSADEALQEEFGVGITDNNVHVLDPFTGTGTFIVRLLQSDIISDKDLRRKFNRELHANELVLLAYYIAAINIEEAYHGRAKGVYAPFDGILLTDTFQLSESEGSFDSVFPENTTRAKRQRKQDIRVIVGNPPYSTKQESANDNNRNAVYPVLDGRIKETYVANSSSTNHNPLYDSYIRAIRWASDRIGDSGIVCYVTNGSFIDNNSMAGLRKCLLDDFSSIYSFNLRGNQRTVGERSRQEGGKIFGSGSRAPIAVTLFIKNPTQSGTCKLFYYDIGDYLSREQKLEIVQSFGSTGSIPWEVIKPNKAHDWINQRDPAFKRFIPIGDKATRDSRHSQTVFVSYSLGVNTNRDAWMYDFSQVALTENMARMIEFYNLQAEDFQTSQLSAEEFIDTDTKKIKWSSSLIPRLKRGEKIVHVPASSRRSMYRPFCKQWLYFHIPLLHRPGIHPRAFPSDESGNVCICVSGLGSADSTVYLVACVPDLNLLQGGAQAFPLYLHEETRDGEMDFGDNSNTGRINISDFALKEFSSAYPSKKMEKEDIFYYVYGILHSPEYKQRFKADLQKMLPRIPKAKSFWTFANAGRELASIHVDYEDVEPYPLEERSTDLGLDPATLYHVQKMRFGKSGKQVDKSTIVYNSCVTLSGIPLDAYEYVLGGRSAIEWIMERYKVTVDKASGIKNDPNDWAKEHDEPRYIIDLLKRVVTVSIKTVKIVKSLPKLEEK